MAAAAAVVMHFVAERRVQLSAVGRAVSLCRRRAHAVRTASQSVTLEQAAAFRVRVPRAVTLALDPVQRVSLAAVTGRSFGEQISGEPLLRNGVQFPRWVDRGR